MPELASSLPSSFKRFVLRPVGVALLVGVSVHGLTAVFGVLAVGMGFFARYSTAFEQSFLLGFITIGAPFIPPFFISIYVQRTLARAREHQFMERAIPGMALGKLIGPAHETSTAIVNSSLANILGEERRKLEADEFLPLRFWNVGDDRDRYFRMLKDNGEVRGLSVQFRRGDGRIRWGTLHSVLREDGIIQATLLDVTAEKELEDEVEQIYVDNVRLFDGIERILGSFHSTDFDVEQAYSSLFGSVLLTGDCRPTHVFSTSVKENGSLAGHVYYLENGDVIKSPDHIKITSGSGVAITRGRGAVHWSNGPEDGESQDAYAKNFHPRVLEIVGGVSNYATYWTGNVAIVAFNYCDGVRSCDADVLKALAVVVNALQTISDQTVETEDAFIYAMEALARACETHDEDTALHLRRLNEYSRELAIELSMDERFVSTISYAAQMHDVGKILIPLEVLLKPGRLTEEEFAVIKRHPKQGADIMGDNARVKMANNIAFTHHEKWDGSGYPRGLKGEEIPIEGRIVALADVYDALRSKRSYKPPFSHEKTMQILTEGDDRLNPEEHFDKDVLNALVKIEGTMDDICIRFSDMAS